MDKPHFVYVTYIDTTPEKLWDALTMPEFTRQYWLGHRILSDWTVGGSVKFLRPDGGIDLKGEVLQADRPRVLSYTWRSKPRSAPDTEENSRVTFEITTRFNATKLTVTHDQFIPQSKLVGEITEGWQGVLSNLKTFLETGKTIPFQWKCG